MNKFLIPCDLKHLRLDVEYRVHRDNIKRLGGKLRHMPEYAHILHLCYPPEYADVSALTVSGYRLIRYKVGGGYVFGYRWYPSTQYRLF
jgi:hypothetical protein